MAAWALERPLHQWGHMARWPERCGETRGGLPWQGQHAQLPSAIPFSSSPSFKCTIAKGKSLQVIEEVSISSLFNLFQTFMHCSVSH